MPGAAAPVLPGAPGVEARDMAVASGMDSGVIEGYERLDELLAG